MGNTGFLNPIGMFNQQRETVTSNVSFPISVSVNGSTRRNPEITVVRNDVGTKLDFTVSDKDGTAIDLTSITTTFKMSKERASANKISAACVNAVAASGICKYTFVAGDLDTAGKYWAELELNFGGGIIKTSERFRMKVLKDAAYGV